MNDPIGISRIGQIAVTVQDVDRAEAFYRDVLGLQHLFRAGPALTFFDCGGVRLMMGLADPGRPRGSGSILYLVVSEIEAAFARLAQADAKIVSAPHFVAKMPDHDLWLGFFEDGEGNTLSLMCERRPAAG